MKERKESESKKEFFYIGINKIKIVKLFNDFIL